MWKASCSRNFVAIVQRKKSYELIWWIFYYSLLFWLLLLLRDGADQPVESRFQSLALDRAGLVDGPRPPLQLRQLCTATKNQKQQTTNGSRRKRNNHRTHTHHTYHITHIHTYTHPSHLSHHTHTHTYTYTHITHHTQRSASLRPSEEKTQSKTNKN